MHWGNLNCVCLPWGSFDVKKNPIQNMCQVSVYRTTGTLVFNVTDINECSTGTPCNGGTCSNTPGTFSCDCTGTGFEGATCVDGKFYSLNILRSYMLFPIICP